MGEFGGTVVGDAVESLAAAVLEGVGTVVGVMTTQWFFVDTLDLANEDGIEGGIADGQPVDHVSPAHAGMDRPPGSPLVVRHVSPAHAGMDLDCS